MGQPDRSSGVSGDYTGPKPKDRRTFQKSRISGIIGEAVFDSAQKRIGLTD
jgi:hypothetical protein